jgi:GTPase SAR1 family protein
MSGHRAVPPRENPFRVDCFERLAFEPPGSTWAELLARLERLGYRAAIVGPHGSGKTTLLDRLVPELRTRGFRVRRARLNDERPAPPASMLEHVETRDCVVLDGRERLGPLAWRRFAGRAERAGGLIVTAHRRGRLPVLVETGTSVELLRRLGRRLAGPTFDAVCPDPVTILDRHDGNLRAVWFELFDRAGIQPVADS